MPNAPVSLNSQKIYNLQAPSASGDMSTKNYADQTMSALESGAVTDLSNALNDPNNTASVLISSLTEKVDLAGNDTLSGSINMGGNRL